MSNIKIILAVLAYSLFSCKSYEHLAGTHVTNVRVTSDTDTAIAALILPYKKAMDAQMNEVIAQCPASLFKEKPESGLTNWVTDALYRQSVKAFSEPIAFVFQNFGGIRVPNLGKGDITVSKIFELMPFDNAQVLVKLSGADVLKFFEYIAEMGGSPVSSNVMMKIKDNKLLEVTLAVKTTAPAKRRDFLKYTSLSGGWVLGQGIPLRGWTNEEKIKITILHTNDVHSRIDPFPMDGSRLQGLGGVAARASMIKSVRKTEPNVLLLDSGDIF